MNQKINKQYHVKIFMKLQLKYIRTNNGKVNWSKAIKYYQIANDNQLQT